MPAQLGGMESEHDILPGNAGCHKFFRHGTRSAVVLHPHLPRLNIHVDDGAMYAALAVPTNVEHLVMIPLRVRNRFGFDLSVRRFVPRILLHHSTYDLPVTFYSIHVTTLSCCSSN